MDTPARPTQPATRLACNRCHQQKLRCHRSPIPGHPCARCENAGVECKFEPPLRPGRPSTRRKSRGKEALSPPKSVPRPYPVTSAAQQEKCMPTSGPSRGYTSELDGVLEEVGSECPLTGSNDDQGNSPFFESNPDEQFFLGCKSPFSDGSLGMATDWPEFSTMPVHSSTPKFHPPSVQHDEIFQHAAANKRENSAPAASTASSVSCTFSPLFSSSSSSSLVSTPSLPPTADVNYCRLLELSTTLHEYCCQLMSVQEAQGESTVISTPTIDQILAVTQSLSEMCSPVSANSGDHNQDTSFQPQSRPSYTHSDADIPSNVPFRSPPDGATVLLILSCYLRLLHLYNAVLSKPSAVGNGNGIQPLCVQIGCFSTAMTSSMSVLACLISQTLGNFEATLKNLASTVCYPKSPSVGEGDRLWQLDTDKGAESSVSILARAALSEVWTLHTSLRQQLQTMNSVCD